MNPDLLSKHTRLILLTLITTGLLSSCMATKSYEAPKVEEGYLFRLDSLQAQNEASTALINWRDFFSDSLLLAYIDTALAGNYSNLQALERITAAEAYFKQSRLEYLPSVEAQAQAQRQDLAPNSQFGSFFDGVVRQYELSATLSWEADLWGRITSQKNVQQALFEQSVTAQQLIRTQLINAVARNYFQLAAADERLTFIEKQIELRKSSVNTISDLKEAGQTTQLAINQAEAQLLEARILKVEVERQIFKLENQMLILLGKKQQDLARNPLDQQSLADNFSAGIYLEMLANRPDVKEAELNYRANFEEVNVARASFYPSIRITATGGYQSLDISQLISPASVFTNLIVGLAQPIFMRGQLLTQMKVAKAMLNESEFAFRETLLTASMEVSSSLKDYQTEQQKLKYRNEQVQELNEGLENAETLLRSGYANYLEVLNVQENLLNSQLSKTEAELARLNAAADLFRALGGGTE